MVHVHALDVIRRSVNDVWSQDTQNSINIALSMDIKVNRLGQIQAEDAHNGLCVNNISAGNQIKINIKLG